MGVVTNNQHPDITLQLCIVLAIGSIKKVVMVGFILRK